jgi:P27 family predicted phage terminase small subunit
MGQRGPKPTPTAVLEQRGSWRAKNRKDEPVAEGKPRCPQWLTGDAKRVWRQLMPKLHASGVAGEIDRNALARYCQLFVRWKELEQYIAEKGTVYPVKNKDGVTVDMKELPHVARASKLADQLLKLEQQFGMTPAARAALASSSDSSESDEQGDDIETFTPKLAG